MKHTTPQQWVSPVIRSYGTFESTTQQGCDKRLGESDSFTFMGDAIVCAS
jgi:hypothetical protein